MKICTGVDLVDLIVDVKFEFEKSGILMSLGVKICPFPLTLHVGLTTVQPVIIIIAFLHRHSRNSRDAIQQLEYSHRCDLREVYANKRTVIILSVYLCGLLCLRPHRAEALSECDAFV